jgi:hypothetical protein
VSGIVERPLCRENDECAGDGPGLEFSRSPPVRVRSMVQIHLGPQAKADWTTACALAKMSELRVNLEALCADEKIRTDQEVGSSPGRTHCAL